MPGAVNAVTALRGPAIRIEGMRRTVSDLRRAVDFYCAALGFELPGREAPPTTGATRLRLGEQHLELVAADGDGLVPTCAGAADPCFQHAAIVAEDMEAAWRRLERYAPVAISRSGPQRLPANAGGVVAFKFRDPDGHPLELIEFPAGVGDPRWQSRHIAGPTIGIDHFAIVVEGIDRSEAFFADRLGWRVASRGLNSGVEQDRLDGLDGALVDVVALEPRDGSCTPHLELLGYRRPARMATIDGSTAAQRAARDEIVCIGARDRQGGITSIRLHDPDGHCFVIEASPSSA
jgi:catechol 2,3-dioxygenase-like lactoylglutathione lyase family enzyme